MPLCCRTAVAFPQGFMQERGALRQTSTTNQ